MQTPETKSETEKSVWDEGFVCPGCKKRYINGETIRRHRKYGCPSLGSSINQRGLPRFQPVSPVSEGINWVNKNIENNRVDVKDSSLSVEDKFVNEINLQKEYEKMYKVINPTKEEKKYQCGGCGEEFNYFAGENKCPHCGIELDV